MILPLSLIALTGPSLIELPDANAPYITFQACVQLGTLDSRGLAEANIAADTLLYSTDGFSHSQLQQYATQTGEMMRCTLSPDHIRVQLEVPKGQLKLGFEILNDLLRHSSFDEDLVSEDVPDYPYRQRGYWLEALEPWAPDYNRLTRADVQDFYRRAFTPENTVIGIGGPFDKAEADADAQTYFADWKAADLPKQYPSLKPVPEQPRHLFPIASIELYGGQYTAGMDSFPAQLLAATALGIGKGSSLHRIAREKLALSYLQQSVVAPTPLGLQTKLLVFFAPSNGQEQLPGTLRKALQDDVSAWNEDIRQRAIGMAGAFLLEGAAMSPLFIDSDRIQTDSLEDRTFMQTYWRQKTGKPWDPEALLAAMKTVSLDDLKKTASDFLANARVRAMPG